ncbi:uncharacterized protein LACBIDRAFT_329790 [Laccaria bicolor S238N-H82]|uniref:Predicted protein n=1 Tax=Laccaria bicolor (strain S238N-H82 / ATCC MYA-4686) TaxID=486041 RepID=B0DJ89_LACBS|nr:uncharacterized protein LACBIDRAFT_329790 [Laccaria bicolor S238N-H82]EDR05479.1 predicted protein [Laccaria bicolor S238N-H82]|eukprot:XP_001884037.1 predicted protein [Laccaria bicolor S238N-H82]
MARGAKGKAAKAPKPVIPTIDWIGNNNALIWKLLNEIEKKQNCSVLYGSKKVLEDSKIKVYKRISEAILPEWYALDPDAIGNRMKNKAEDLYARYKKEIKRLQQTGGGLGGNDDSPDDPDDVNEYLTCYIPNTGPDITTTQEALNVWAPCGNFGAGGNEDNIDPQLRSTVTTQAGAPQPDVTDATHQRLPLGDISVDNRAIPEAPTPAVTPSAPPMTPARPPPQSTPGGKENTAPVTGKKGPKESSFVLASIVETAKSSIKKIPQKRSFEETLCEISQFVFILIAILYCSPWFRQNMEAANNRAAVLNQQNERRLRLEELEQCIKLHTLGVYSKEELLNLLRDLDGSQPAPKRVCPRSPSPRWDIENDGFELND